MGRVWSAIALVCPPVGHRGGPAVRFAAGRRSLRTSVCSDGICSRGVCLIPRFTMTKTIMTADDSPSIRQMVGFTLRQAGYQIIEACDGRDALAKLQQQPVHLLITDLNMPNLDGIELIRQVRALPAHRFTPVLFLTTESQAERKLAAKAAGATGWIVKPFTPDQLVAVVGKVLR